MSTDPNIATLPVSPAVVRTAAKVLRDIAGQKANAAGLRKKLDIAGFNLIEDSSSQDKVRQIYIWALRAMWFERYKQALQILTMSVSPKGTPMTGDERKRIVSEIVPAPRGKEARDVIVATYPDDYQFPREYTWVYRHQSTPGLWIILSAEAGNPYHCLDAWVIAEDSSFNIEFVDLLFNPEIYALFQLPEAERKKRHIGGAQGKYRGSQEEFEALIKPPGRDASDSATLSLRWVPYSFRDTCAVSLNASFQCSNLVKIFEMKDDPIPSFYAYASHNQRIV